MIVIKTAETITTLIQSWSGIALPIHMLDGYRAELLNNGQEMRIVENGTEKVFDVTTYNNKLKFMLIHYAEKGALFAKYNEAERVAAIKIWLSAYAAIKTVNFIYRDPVDEGITRFSFTPHIQDDLKLVNPEWRINLFSDGERIKVQLLDGETHFGVVNLTDNILKRMGATIKFETGGVSINIPKEEMRVFIPAELEHNCYNLSGDTLILAFLEWYLHEKLAYDREFGNVKTTRQFDGCDQATAYMHTIEILKEEANKFLN